MGKRKDELVPVKVARALYDKLMQVGEDARPKLSQRAMVEDALEMWLEDKAPVLVQNSQKR